MKRFVKKFGIVALVSIIGFSMISCNFFAEKDCSHCNGTGRACGLTILSTCGYCYESWPDCWVCSGSGKVPDW